MCVFFKEIVVGADILQLVPLFGADGERIQIIYSCALYGKKKRRMGGYDKLTAVKAGGILYKRHHFLLQLGR